MNELVFLPLAGTPDHFTSLDLCTMAELEMDWLPVILLLVLGDYST